MIKLQPAKAGWSFLLEYKFSRIGKFQVRAALAVIHDSGVCDHTADGVARDKQDQAVDGVYKEKQVSYDQLQYRRGAIGCSVYHTKIEYTLCKAASAKKAVAQDKQRRKRQNNEKENQQTGYVLNLKGGDIVLHEYPTVKISIRERGQPREVPVNDISEYSSDFHNRMAPFGEIDGIRVQTNYSINLMVLQVKSSALPKENSVEKNRGLWLCTFAVMRVF